MSNIPDFSTLSSTRRPFDTGQSSPYRLLGSWQLEQQVASGVMTSVYFARPLGCPPSWHADYVVKTLTSAYVDDPLARNLMQREAEVGRHSSHPNLVPILEARLDTRRPHIVMPRLEGANLGTVIARVGRITVPQSLWFVRQIAQALRHLHAQGWIHADVKPSNIIVSPKGHATLIDLGSALKSNESIYCWERPVIGTLLYVAPEMLISATQTGPAADVYSLGVSLYEMLSGRRPFNADDPSKLVEAQLTQTPPPLVEIRHDVPTDVAELVKRMLAKVPLRRPQSADELIDELMRLEIETLGSRIPSDAA